MQLLVSQPWCSTIKDTERLAEAGIEPSVGSVGDSYDNALAETINGLRSSTAEAHGAASRPSSSPRSNGSTGSTTDACSRPSATYRRPKPKRASTRKSTSSPWWRDSKYLASGKPGAVHTSFRWATQEVSGR